MTLISIWCTPTAAGERIVSVDLFWKRTHISLGVRTVLGKTLNGLYTQVQATVSRKKGKRLYS